MNMNADERAQFREGLAHLTDAEIANRLYLCGLIQRVDSEILAMKLLFGSGEKNNGDGQLVFEPPVDTQVTAFQHIFQAELKRRFAAQAKAKEQQKRSLLEVAAEGEEQNHAAQQNGNH
jgi:hypothetical protein